MAELAAAELRTQVDDLTRQLAALQAANAREPAERDTSHGFEKPPRVVIPARKPLVAIADHKDVCDRGNKHSLARPAFAANHPEFFNPKFIPTVAAILEGRNAASVRHEALHSACVASYMIDYCAALEDLAASDTITHAATQKALAVVTSGFKRIEEMITFRFMQLSVISEGRDLGLVQYAQELVSPNIMRPPPLSSAFAQAQANYRDKFTGAMLKNATTKAAAGTGGSHRDRGQAADPGEPSGSGTQPGGRRGPAANTRSMNTRINAAGGDAPAAAP